MKGEKSGAVCGFKGKIQVSLNCAGSKVRYMFMLTVLVVVVLWPIQEYRTIRVLDLKAQQTRQSRQGRHSCHTLTVDLLGAEVDNLCDHPG